MVECTWNVTAMQGTMENVCNVGGVNFCSPLIWKYTDRTAELGERVGVWPTLMCAPLPHPFPHFLFHPFYVCLVGDKEGFHMGDTLAGWEQKGLSVLRGLTELGQLTRQSDNASWCLNPWLVCQGNRLGNCQWHFCWHQSQRHDDKWDKIICNGLLLHCEGLCQSSILFFPSSSLNLASRHLVAVFGKSITLPCHLLPS